MADVLSQHIKTIHVPQKFHRVYKEECAYSFDTPESPDGLFICMTTFVGLGKKHVQRYFEKTGHAVYLNLKRNRKQIEKTDSSPSAKKPTRLAIGVDGGFDPEEKKYEIEEFTSILMMPNWTYMPCKDLPLEVSLSVAGIMAAEDPLKQDAIEQMTGTWDGEARVISKFATNLPQLDKKITIPPSGWKCDKCDLTSNLWLNLTDGSILCGRKFFDGSGGNNHAVDHFAQTKYPLAVKLGTINEKGGDVFSYEEDDMVEDPHLAQHLLHWGINIAAMVKTEKTMAELEIDLNQKIGEWDVIQEAGAALTPLYGPGYTGIHNLGNSCYLNSVMQVLFTITDFHKRYVSAAEAIFKAGRGDVTQDFNVQMAKFGCGIMSGDYSQPPTESAPKQVPLPPGIKPQMFKSLIGRGHPEFSTKRQQDAQEFLLYIVNMIERTSRGSFDPTRCFKFMVEDRLECQSSHKVHYATREECCLSLPVPLEAATNAEAVKIYRQQIQAKETPKSVVRPRITLQACLEKFAAGQHITDFFSSAIQSKTTAQQCSKLKTFPDYIFIHMKKFTVGEDWAPVKQDISLDVPDQLNLDFLRSAGFQQGREELLPEAPSHGRMVVDDHLVSELMETGMPFNACHKAAYYTGNAGREASMQWLLEHLTDPDFAEPLGDASGPRTEFNPSPEALEMIMTMGFSSEQACKALKQTDNNIERAVDWIFSHADELREPMEVQSTIGNINASTAAAPPLTDGSGNYTLVAFISHMGMSPLVGHYVCHIRRDGQWVIYNDEKVAVSQNPPRDLAYIYLYKRSSISS